MRTEIQKIVMVEDRLENQIVIEAVLEAPGRELVKANSDNQTLKCIFIDLFFTVCL